MRACYDRVIKRGPGKDECAGRRTGTAYARRAQLEAALGQPTYINRPCEDDRVSVGWIFDTPRGEVEIRDFRFNLLGEWSIASETEAQARWLVGYLRTLDIPAFVHRGGRAPQRPAMALDGQSGNLTQYADPWAEAA